MPSLQKEYSWLKRSHEQHSPLMARAGNVHCDSATGSWCPLQVRLLAWLWMVAWVQTSNPPSSPPAMHLRTQEDDLVCSVSLSLFFPHSLISCYPPK